MTYPRESTTGQHRVKQVKAAGGIAYKFVSPGRRPVPDRLILLPGGRMLFTGRKAPGKTPTPAQQREHERIRAPVFNVLVPDSKNTEGVLQEPASRNPVVNVFLRTHG